MTGAETSCVYASCVSIHGQGVLLMGSSGTGKSDVALRLIDGGAQLVSDDQTVLRLEGPLVIASPPASLAGLLEIRTVGLLRLSWQEAPVALAVELAAAEEPLERLPEEAFVALLGQKIRKLCLPGFAASTPAAIRAALSGDFAHV